DHLVDAAGCEQDDARWAHAGGARHYGRAQSERFADRYGIAIFEGGADKNVAGRHQREAGIVIDVSREQDGVGEPRFENATYGLGLLLSGAHYDAADVGMTASQPRQALYEKIEAIFGAEEEGRGKYRLVAGEPRQLFGVEGSLGRIASQISRQNLGSIEWHAERDESALDVGADADYAG